MPPVTRREDRVRLLAENAPAETFRAAPRGYPASIHPIDPADHDVALMIRFYANLTRGEGKARQARDLIVCPPVNGGARGMALATCDNLPVLIFHDNDTRDFVPEPNVCHDIDEFVREVERNIGLGPGYRETYTSASGVAPFSDAYNRNCALRFVDAAWAASLRGWARLNAAALTDDDARNIGKQQ